MSNNKSVVSSNWPGFYKLWLIVAIILLILLILLWLLGYGPGGKKCEVPPTIIEKKVDVEKRIDNPEHLTRIKALEKDNSKIAGLMTTIKGLETGNAEIAGLKDKIAELETDSSEIPKLQEKIKKLTSINAQLPKLLEKTKSLEEENQGIAGLKEKISELESANGEIPKLRKKIKELENAEPKVKIVEKIEEKVVKVPVVPAAPVSPASPEPVKLMNNALSEVAKIYFGSGSTEFSASYNQTLSDLLVFLRENDDASVVISGFHDSAGSPERNHDVAKLRTKNIADLFLNSGISTERIELKKPEDITGTGDAKEAHRVEITIVR